MGTLFCCLHYWLLLSLFAFLGSLHFSFICQNIHFGKPFILMNSFSINFSMFYKIVQSVPRFEVLGAKEFQCRYTELSVLFLYIVVCREAFF